LLLRLLLLKCTRCRGAAGTKVPPKNPPVAASVGAAGAPPKINPPAAGVGDAAVVDEGDASPRLNGIIDPELSLQIVSGVVVVDV